VPLIYWINGFLSLEEPSETTITKSERKEAIITDQTSRPDKTMKTELKRLWEEKVKARKEANAKDKDLNKLKAMFPFKTPAKGPNPLS
jgi:hypothetical protein